jgi:hypothetical protein
MLAKMTAKNQITLPKAIFSQYPPAEYYEIATEGGRIVLTPVKLTRMDRVWDKLDALGITEADMDGAVNWGRSQDQVLNKTA